MQVGRDQCIMLRLGIDTDILREAVFTLRQGEAVQSWSWPQDETVERGDGFFLLEWTEAMKAAAGFKPGRVEVGGEIWIKGTEDQPDVVGTYFTLREG